MVNDMSIKIKQLRQAKGMTLEQVATIVGVGKSTVRKWETGMIANMGRDKIAALALALGVTPAYLMGWEEPTQTPFPNVPGLTDGETDLLEWFRTLSDEEQKIYLEMFRARLKARSKD
jgi:transcriptional regulator with XRE-family HTH domain